MSEQFQSTAPFDASRSKAVTEPIRLAVCLETLGMGGISSYCLDLITALNTTGGVIPYLVAVHDDRDDFMIHESARRGVHLHTLRSQGRYDRSVISRFRTFVSANRIQIVHTQAYRMNVISRLGQLRLKPAQRPKLVATVHGPPPFRNAGLRSRIYYISDFLTFGFLDAIIAVSQAARNQLIRWRVPGARKAVVIPNGICPPPPPDPAQLAELRDSFHLRSDAPVIGYLGRLGPEKGIEFLSTVVAQTLRRIPSTQFLIVGHGPESRHLEAVRNQWPANVVLAGRQPAPHRFYPLMDLLVLTSQTEGLPLVLLEAFSHGVPAVATEVGGVPEVIQDGVNGLLCPYGETDRMVAQIDKLLNDCKLRKEMGRAARATFEARFTAQQMAAKTLEVYNRMLQSTR